ncbi:MAG: DUF58 domain-containing protein [Chthoniobacteraceae bacterium]
MASPLFDSAFLAKLEQLYLLARKLFRGDQRAERRAHQIGSSLEFADYRNYAPGDDLRNIDWNIYGRLDRLFIKLFEEEQDLHIYLLVDASASMHWTPRPGALSKFDQARRLAASLAYIGLANLDRVNVLTFDAVLGRDTGFLRGKSQFYKALDFLRVEPSSPRPTQLAESCRLFARRMKRRGLVFVLSDFFDPRGYEEALALLRHSQFDVHAIQIADPAELNPDGVRRPAAGGSGNRGADRDHGGPGAASRLRAPGAGISRRAEYVLPPAPDRSGPDHHGDALRGSRAEGAARREAAQVTFLNPFGFWFLAGLPLIVLLYLRRIQRRPATVSTLLFWQRVLEEKRPRALFQKLRQLLSLLFHLLIFLLILAALAKPVLNRFAVTSASTVLVLDARARMQAVEPGGGTRFAHAVELATAYAHSVSANHELALLIADNSSEVVAPFTTDSGEIIKALQPLHATDAPGSLDSALGLAAQLLATRSGPGEIVVLTDSPTSVPHPAKNVRVLSTGSALDNVAITRFGARPLPDSPQTSAVYLELANFGAKPASGSVEITLDHRLVDVKPYQLAPGQHWTQSFTVVPSNALNARGWLTARLDHHDALTLDDVAFAALPANTTRRVLLVTKGNLFLEKALQANPLLNSEVLAPEAYHADLAAGFEAVIFDNFMPGGFSLASTTGNFLFIHQTPFTANGELNLPLVSDADSNHPLLRLVDFNSVTFLHAGALAEPSATGGWTFQSPLKSFEHPLIVTGSRARPNAPAQHLAAFAFDVGQTDLPLRVAFPLLMNNTLQWLSGGDEAPATALTAGDTVALANGAKVWTQPQTGDTALPANPSPLQENTFQPLQNGFYLEQAAPSSQWLAVNTFNDAEANLRTAQPDATAPAPLPTIAGGWWHWPLWIYLALAAFALFTLEWWLFHRRTTE